MWNIPINIRLGNKIELSSQLWYLNDDDDDDDDERTMYTTYIMSDPIRITSEPVSANEAITSSFTLFISLHHLFFSKW